MRQFYTYKQNVSVYFACIKMETLYWHVLIKSLKLTKIGTLTNWHFDCMGRIICCREFKKYIVVVYIYCELFLEHPVPEETYVAFGRCWKGRHTKRGKCDIMHVRWDKIVVFAPRMNNLLLAPHLKVPLRSASDD